MATDNVTLYARREALIREKARKGKTGYVTKEEFMNDLRESLTEMFRAQRNGVKRKTLREAMDEL